MSLFSVPSASKVSAARMQAHWRDLIGPLWRALADPYRPELYYMRGPGPKWHEKHLDPRESRALEWRPSLDPRA
jgi:hypothetical protein